jgi:cytoskeletal protein CcmA (bactofilin family)
MIGSDERDSDDGGQPRRIEIGGKVREERRVAAWIGSSIVIRGDLTSSEDLTIAGTVEGDVAVPKHTLVIAPSARVRGDIVARAVAVHGKVSGSVTADGKVEVGETGSVDGDISTPRMVVAEGAVLRGRVGIAAQSVQVS